MKEYMTRQRAQVLALLQGDPARDFSAEELAERLQGSGVNRSTVYRNLDKLAQNGMVLQKISADGTRKVYRYNAAYGCAGHLHLVCARCGRVVHLEHGLTEDISSLLQRESGFCMDAESTVIRGLCDRCK